jgi:hypothetical protein
MFTVSPSRRLRRIVEALPPSCPELHRRRRLRRGHGLGAVRRIVEAPPSSRLGCIAPNACVAGTVTAKNDAAWKRLSLPNTPSVRHRARHEPRHRTPDAYREAG